MEQETKVCSGKFGCGKELSIKKFKKFKNKTVKGEIRIGRLNTCYSCLNKKQRARNPEEEDRKRLEYNRRPDRKKANKEAIDRYRKTEKGRQVHLNNCRKSREKYQPIFNIRAKKKRDDLHDSYIKSALKDMNFITPPIITPELIEVKRSQLLLYRQTNENTN